MARTLVQHHAGARFAAVSVVTAALLLAAVCLPASAETEVELRTRVISALRVVEARPATELAAQYRGDGNPQTIEVVYLRGESQGPSRVSEDGQVVYLARRESTSKHWEKFLNRAFEIHFRKARAFKTDKPQEGGRGP